LTIIGLQILYKRLYSLDISAQLPVLCLDYGSKTYRTHTRAFTLD